MDLIPYHKKQVLIIEDLAEMRSSLKSMLGNMGVQHVETIGNGEDALEKLRSTHYDIIFSDYELGRGKDGQQVLEECRAAKLVKAETIFIMVTAAQTVEMVMGALEYEPDGYIAKPVTLEILRTRLNKIVRTKEVYRDINAAIDRRDTSAALDACNRLAVEKPKFALAAYRIKGKLLIEAGRHEEARDIFETVLGIKRVGWAVLGMAKVHYFAGEFEEARKLLEGLATTNAKYVEAHDWLAKVLEMQGKYNAAQKVLEKAVATSAKSVLRQQALARLAEMNNDYDVMYKACRKSIALGKNSYFRNPQIYISLAKSIQPRIKHGSMRDQKLAFTEAMGLIESARTEFDNMDQLTSIKAALIEAQTLFNAGKQNEGKLAFKFAQMQLEKAGNLNLDDKLDIMLARLALDDENAAKAYAEMLLSQVRGNRRLENKYYGVMETHLSGKHDERLALMKKRGEELTNRGDWEDATDVYLRASQLKNSDDDVRLSALRAAVGMFKNGRKDNSKIKEIDDILAQLATMDASNPRYSVFERAQREWKEVTTVEEVPAE